MWGGFLGFRGVGWRLIPHEKAWQLKAAGAPGRQSIRRKAFIRVEADAALPLALAGTLHQLPLGKQANFKRVKWPRQHQLVLANKLKRVPGNNAPTVTGYAELKM